MTIAYDVVVVGGGHAGAQAAIALRQRGHTGSILIVNAESELPYQRPPLSKEYLAGTKDFQQLLIRPPAFWPERDIALRVGRSVVTVDPQRKELTLDNDERLAYGKLIWAAGGVARRLTCAGRDLLGVHTIRNRWDVDRLVLELVHGAPVVIVGGGYIGLEAAAVLVKRTGRVSVLEAQDRVLARVAGAPLSRFFEAEHRRAGVDLRTSVAVAGLEGQTRVDGVRLADGARIAAGVVIVGVGIDPAIAPLQAAGAEIANGVVVDAFCRTSLADIFAIGDCAAHLNPFADGARIRLESVQNAADQAVIAARAILNDPEPYVSAPWFWSHQYDLKLQTVGLSTGHDAALVRGNPEGRSFSVVYLKQGRVIALDCVNAIKDYAQGRQLVVERAVIDPILLVDPAVPLKSVGEPPRTQNIRCSIDTGGMAPSP